MSPDMDWRDVVRADVDDLPLSQPRAKAGLVSLTADMRAPAHAMLAEAATARRMSVSSYVRRAAMAMVAHDRGISVHDLIAIDPRVSRETGYAVVDPDGDAFGPWEIVDVVIREAEGDD